MVQSMHDQTLARQSLARPLSPSEQALAAALEAAFAAGQHDFTAVAASLQAKGIARPSGSKDPWTLADLETELATLNASFDAAYAKAGIGA